MPEAEPIIRVEHISKQFRLDRNQVSLRHEAQKLFTGLLRRDNQDQTQPFRALDDVSFDIHAGESVALVGRNGSGKTTLLRIMTRIMRPSSGQVQITGRYTALIGLGAGFLPKMTGRQNIYLNAAIHGIEPRQTDELLETIIDFADLGQFVDIPVKDYSSGMKARLGFSVAVHILPDIIFLDEVLAVGDAAFQQKCVERILLMRQQGKTLIFVSHSASAVKLVCERAIWLDHGQLAMDGPTDTVLNAYQARYGGQRKQDNSSNIGG